MSTRVRTPTVLQMEAVECGAAALAIILAHHGRYVPLEELRVECGVSRDGSKALNIVRAARKYGLEAAGFSKEPSALRAMTLPVIVFWNFNHFLVVEGFGKKGVHLNDPATGPRMVSDAEFDQSFTGVVLTFAPTPSFQPGGEKRGVVAALKRRLHGAQAGLVVALVAGLGLVLPGLAIPTFSRVFVDDILIGGMDDWLSPLLIGLALTALLRASFTWIQQRTLVRLEVRVALLTASQFVDHVLRLPVQFYYQRFPGEIGSRVQINDRVAKLLSTELATTFIGVVTVVFYALVMLSYDVTLTIIGVAFVTLNVGALQYAARRRRDENFRLLRDRGQVMGVAMAGLQGIEDLKSTGGEAEFFSTWSGLYAKAMNGEQRLSTYSAYLMAVPFLLDTLNTAAILSIGGLRVMDGHLSVGMLVAFQSLMSSFSTPINQLVRIGMLVQDAGADMNRLDDVLRHPRDPLATTGSTDPATAVRLTGQLEIRNLTFGYSPLAPPLIENFNLTVRPGERIALVGGSGSGKSTIARLVAGLFEPWAGEVLFDGMKREAIPRAILNHSVAFVDQDIFLFGASVRDNLTLWDRTAGDTNVLRAGRDACIQDDIIVRRDSYDSLVEEAGVNFSGGQRQRLEIARALVVNPTLLVLDEATSALDSNTEKVIDDNLRRRGCACLIVAHRLSTIRDCDEIIVLQKGQVVQRGTHDTLKSVDGPYQRLIES